MKDFLVEMVHVLFVVYLGELQTNNNMMAHLQFPPTYSGIFHL